MIITKVSQLCNTISKLSSVDELELVKKELANAEASIDRCPSCGSPDSLSSNGYYSRHFITYKDGRVRDDIIAVHCLHCSSCRRSHAVLPADITPYSSFSPGFLLSVIYCFCAKRFGSQDALADHFKISVKTLTRIITAYRRDVIFMKSVLVILQRRNEKEFVFGMARLPAAQIFGAMYDFRVSFSKSFLARNIRLSQRTPGLRPITNLLQ